jgi:hypothetical protein
MPAWSALGHRAPGQGVHTMTASLARSDFRVLRDLADRWQGQRRPRAAEDLHAVLDEIEARRPAGGDVFRAAVSGESIPDLHARALMKAADLWGLDASVVVERTGTISETLFTSRGRYHADVTVRCLNYAEIRQRQDAT